MTSNFDNFAEYRDPERYDAEYGKWLPDGPFYERLAIANGGPLLDAGCGTGRIAVPLARRGLAVTGLDMAPEMLAAARARSVGLPATWIEADARSFELGRRFRLAIMAAHAFQHLLGERDQRAAAATIHRHLDPGGVFAFDARNPVAHDPRDIMDEEPWHTFRDKAGRTVTVTGLQRWDAAGRILVYTTIRRLDGTMDRRDLSIYFAEIPSIVELLHDVGFADVTVAGGYADEPFDPKASMEAVVTARR